MEKQSTKPISEKRTMKCSPCTYEGIPTASTMFCVECNEYLCNTCVKHHQKFSMLRRHMLVKKDDSDGMTGKTTFLNIAKSKTLPSEKSKGSALKLPATEVHATDNADTITYETANIHLDSQSCGEICDTEDNQGYVRMGSIRRPSTTDPLTNCSSSGDKEPDYINCSEVPERQPTDHQSTLTTSNYKLNQTIESSSSTQLDKIKGPVQMQQANENKKENLNHYVPLPGVQGKV